jgi:hypothetical protein
MKLSTKSAFVLLAGMAISYSACNKDSSPAKTTTPTTVGYDAVSSAVAANFSGALSGSLGGANINDGLTPKAQELYPAGADKLCGFVANSNVNYTTNSGGIKSTVTGQSKFFFDCVGGEPIGYTLTDALVTTGTGPGYDFTYDIAQGYQIASENSTATLLKVVGTLQAYKDVVYSDKKITPTSEHDAFVITDATVDISSKGKDSIDGGTATFTTKGSNAQGSWNYVGTMDFIGNDIGKLTFYGHVYYVNLATGKIVTI